MTSTISKKPKGPSKYLYIFDPGHGGIINSKYQTSGKRSPRFDSGFVLYEGVNNRDNVSRLIKIFKDNNLDCVDIVDSQKDIPLSTRIARANKLAKERKCIYISVHSDAAGNGKDWHPASGVSVYTSKGQTASDPIAELVINKLEDQLKESVKWRFDTWTDKDKDKEANYAVLKKTSCPAILLELGFHSNKEESKRILTDEFKEKVCNAILSAALELESN